MSPTCASDGPPFWSRIRGSQATSSVASAWLSGPTFAAGSFPPSTSTTFVIEPHTSPVTTTRMVTEADSPGSRVMGPHCTVVWVMPPVDVELAMMHGWPSNVGKGGIATTSASPGGSSSMNLTPVATSSPTFVTVIV